MVRAKGCMMNPEGDNILDAIMEGGFRAMEAEGKTIVDIRNNQTIGPTETQLAIAKRLMETAEQRTKRRTIEMGEEIMRKARNNFEKNGTNTKSNI